MYWRLWGKEGPPLEMNLRTWERLVVPFAKEGGRLLVAILACERQVEGRERRCRERAMVFGVFGLFGRSKDVRRLEQALQGCGLNSRAVDHAILLTVIRLLRAGPGLLDPAVQQAAEMLSYAALGPDDFEEENGAALGEALQGRAEDAARTNEGIDAQILLLALQCGLANETIAERFEWDVESD